MTTSYLNDSYLDKAKEALPEEDPRVSNVRDRLYDMAGQATADPNNLSGYGQVDLRPDWYKTFLSKNQYDQNGPPLPTTAGDLITNGAQAVAQGDQNNANRIAQLPGARAKAIMQTQRKANSSATLGALMGTFANKKSNDFDTQQKRAVADTATLRKNQKTGLSFNDLLGLANYDKTLTRNEQLARRDAEKNAQTIVENDPNSKESRDAQTAMVKVGIMGPETAGGMSKENIKLARTGAMQTQAQEHKDEYFDRTEDRRESSQIGQEERADVRRVEQEKREESLRRQQSQIPGYRWQNDTPPPAATVVLARDLATSREEMMKSATRLAQIQQKLEELRGPAAAVGQNVDAYIGPQYSKDLLAEAKLAQSKMTTAARKLDAMGVPQQFELEIQNSLNPVSGTIGAYFRGSAPWDAINKYYDQTGRNQINKLGLFEENDTKRPVGADLHAQPSEEQVPRYARPPVRRAGGAPAPTPVEAPVGAPAGTLGGGDSLGSAQLPPQPDFSNAASTRVNPPEQFNAPGGDEPLPGTWTIRTAGGQSKPRVLTRKQYKMATDKYGIDSVTKAQ